MLPNMFEIICVEDQNREKFDLLSRRVGGWGLERLHFASTDALGLMRVKRFGKDNVVVVIGEYTTLTSGQTREGYVALLLEDGVTQEQIIVLEGNESPEQIENLVRVKIFTLLNLQEYQV